MGRHLPTMAALESMCLDELQSAWLIVCNTPAPRLPIDLLRLGLAYRLQEHRLGGLNGKLCAALQSTADPASSMPKPSPRILSPGMMLVRDWHGVAHRVTVLDKGFGYDGKVWLSLTAIAFAITGARWSGPRFFGLKA
jgi:Protein of unknown function (DUF2924)